MGLSILCDRSVNTATRLQRNFDGVDQPETLGELLKRKAEEEVHVIVLVWSDVTSVAGLGMKDGLMGTYDQWTKDYFMGTKVDCVLARRRAADDVGSMLGPFLGALKGTAFTHHQKVRSPQNRRALQSTMRRYVT